MADYATRSPVDSDRDLTSQQPMRHSQTVGETAAEAGGDIMRSAKDQGRQVVAETSRQARGLYHQARSEVDSQVRVQHGRAVSGLRALADETGRLAERSDESGPVTQFAQDAATRLRRAGDWLEDREPARLVDEVKTYARRHPGMFLAGAAILGVVAGRMAKNLAGESGSAAMGTAPVVPASRASTMDGGVTAGPVATGAVANGPVANGPVANGPYGTGPIAAGPMGAGPIEMQPADGHSASAGRS